MLGRWTSDKEIVVWVTTKWLAVGWMTADGQIIHV